MPIDFWYDNVSLSCGKYNIFPEAWIRICKIRNTPIRLIENHVIGEVHKPHMVIPAGYQGYLIDYPEVFNLREDELKLISNCKQCLDHNDARLPAWFFGVDHIVFLTDEEYEIIPPYFDMGLANYGESHRMC